MPWWYFPAAFGFTGGFITAGALAWIAYRATRPALARGKTQEPALID